MCCYHPSRNFCSCLNLMHDNSFVKISAQLSLVWTLMTCTVPLSTWSQKWWYLMERCLVLGHTTSELAIVKQLWLSSKISDLRCPEKMWVPEMVTSSIKLWVDSSCMRVHIGSTLRIHILSAWYSALVVLKVISVWSLLVHAVDRHRHLDLWPSHRHQQWCTATTDDLPHRPGYSTQCHTCM